MNNALASIFPTENEIPEVFKIHTVVEQREYLVNGELRVWDGKLNEVLSPVFIKEGEIFTQKILGQTPLLTEKESLEALVVSKKYAEFTFHDSSFS
jgi:glyceraldehyde-3-phosphate dehydrogenase (NADP+)